MSTPSNDVSRHYLPSWPRHAVEMAQIAYELTTEAWPLTGQGPFHPIIANGHDYNNIVDEIANRMVALLVIRLVALLTCRLGNRCCVQQKRIYGDFSTTSICRAVLAHAKQQAVQNQDWESYDPSFNLVNGHDDSSSVQGPPFPAALTPEVLDQLHAYTLAICKGYHPAKEVPYHNVEHAYHVFLSANKLLDLMLCESDEGGENQSHGQNRKHRPTYGIKCDPLVQLAFLFSALIHDVDHTGISNRQLVLESDDLAVLYNDQSVAEQRSLAVAFSTLKQPEYKQLRDAMFKSLLEKPDAAPDLASTSNFMSDGEDYLRFRKLVIDLVLATDIASPERTQIVKSKWKEAFGEAQFSEKMKRSNDTDKRIGKNVNFEQDVIVKEQQKLAAANDRNVTDSIISISSVASALSIDTDFSDSASSTVSEDDFNQSSVSSQKMNNDEVVSNCSGSIKSINAKSSEKARFRRSKSGSHQLSASAVVTTGRKKPARPAGFSRSMISTSSEIKNYSHESRRLGVRRALDLAGSTIEAVSSTRVHSESTDVCNDIDDDADEFKASTCLEQMLRAADVGALLQDFENVRKWSTRLYKELTNGFYARRGDDPKVGWFDNQIKVSGIPRHSTQTHLFCT